MAAGHRWGPHSWAENLKAGEQIQIWAGGAGNRVGPLRQASQAATDAIGVAVSLWFGVVAAAAGALYVLRRRLDRSRYAQWDRELDTLADDDGGRTNRHS